MTPEHLSTASAFWAIASLASTVATQDCGSVLWSSADYGWLVRLTPLGCFLDVIELIAAILGSAIDSLLKRWQFSGVRLRTPTTNARVRREKSDMRREILQGCLALSQLVKLMSCDGVPLLQTIAMVYAVSYVLHLYFNWKHSGASADFPAEFSEQPSSLDRAVTICIGAILHVATAIPFFRWFISRTIFQIISQLKSQVTHIEYKVVLAESIHFLLMAVTGIPACQNLDAYYLHQARQSRGLTRARTILCYYIGVLLLFINFSALNDLILSLSDVHYPENTSEQAPMETTKHPTLHLHYWLPFTIPIGFEYYHFMIMGGETLQGPTRCRLLTLYLLVATVILGQLYFEKVYDAGATRKPGWAEFLG